MSHPPFNFSRIGIIGAGMMGAGIAFEAAKAGIQVLLKDVTIEQAQQGKSYSERVCLKLIELGKMQAEQMAPLLANIHPVADYDTFHDLDMIVEAVFEDMDLKKTVIEASQSGLRPGAFFASNTTSLLISELAESSQDPTNFIGMHFFSPVDRMKLVEIIRGKETSPQTVEKATQLAHILGKTVIVVNDGPGFYTSRVFFNYLLEAISMLLEGIPAEMIEAQARQAGFGASPLAVLDEISLPLMLHVYDQLPSLSNSQRRAYRYLETLIAQGRSGRKTGKGFYNYGESKNLWKDPTLPTSAPLIDEGTIAKRLLHIMALDSYRCLEEGILDSTSDGDTGSILGIGYPRHTGGVFQHIDQVGLPQFVQECEQFADKGEQWEIPDSLRERG
ncbi:3-hydroxyacyl-CoA dehydrogenase family protein [Sphingobacterium paucimobilis]|nr:3-hydroxyacyl-CoA dehydrogenase family protein [Sphingobacterium paucimobilis]